MTHHDTSLAGRTALVTGVSRRKGIGYAVARELAGLGASVFTHHYSPHDADQPWGADDLAAVHSGVRAALQGDAASGSASADLRDPAQVDELFDAARALTGSVDILVCNHARSGGDGSILDMTVAALDAFWQTNTRSTLLLTRRFAQQLRPVGPGTTVRPGERLGRTAPSDPATAPKVVWMTSGQEDGPMRGEVAYATSKAALAGVTATVAAELLELGIVLNTVNPGPVNTGYLDPGTTDRPLAELEELRTATPFGRWGEPTDPARLIGWLVSPAGSWVVGQRLTTDGGFALQ
ncbi:3-oxoacyl-[acyl-carrier protein] reductase [Isoptericola sp. CG 20/1183]|uniref:3-oxoacyl-[acyl-carrier protein] reductase n=1 Tax=Isoptericola halotolerans TaxID=300560 RepID=A0ABX5EHE4_9MICO|nr:MULTISPECIES: SDR family oxidoreductase [Isoptericola]PRZ02905.1 3-oxoacyl-[acyl-carrier protein] reductase [Isoptericola sp. CG 20/1183]PRZ09902.1 3-oxoacyl-[acyl-carrier protein] reductase [Isoptericola halotolerans]